MALLLQEPFTTVLTMLTFLKTLFQKKPDASAPVGAVASPSVSVAQPQAASPVRAVADQGTPAAQVAVARLSLLPILQKLPEDLRANIAKYPDGTPTVALPLATIQKQLAQGSVKMSLASLYRQAPAGTFTSAKVEDKRMIEVPMAEVLRHVQPMNLRRRADQRKVDLPSNAPQLFGDRSNPFAVAPSEGDDEPAPAPRPRAQEEAPSVETAPPYFVPLKMEAGAEAKSAKPSALATPSVEGEVTIPLAMLMGGWPEPARAEAAAMMEAVVEIPAALLAPMMGRGKVIFSWGQVRSWIKPAPTGQTEAREATEIVLPIKVVAPAFIMQTKPVTPRKQVDMDETIPSLFDGGEAARPVSPAPAPAPVEPIAIVDVPRYETVQMSEPLRMQVSPVEDELELEEDDASETPAALPFRLKVETESESEAPAPEPEPVEAAVPASLPEPIPHVNGTAKVRSPHEMMEAITKLPGVAGAIVALREGLPVAAKLPEQMKADTVAAFLPQIFGRLNNYTQEMQIGEVEDLLLTVNGAHFQGYHMGEIYFAVLGQPGQALPWQELREMVHELQTQAPA